MGRCHVAQGAQLNGLCWPRGAGSGEWGGREVKEGGDRCIHIADSLHCIAETNTTLESNYTPIIIPLGKASGKIKYNCILS